MTIYCQFNVDFQGPYDKMKIQGFVKKIFDERQKGSGAEMFVKACTETAEFVWTIWKTDAFVCRQ